MKRKKLEIEGGPHVGRPANRTDPKRHAIFPPEQVTQSGHQDRQSPHGGDRTALLSLPVPICSRVEQIDN